MHTHLQQWMSGWEPEPSQGKRIVVELCTKIDFYSLAHVCGCEVVQN